MGSNEQYNHHKQSASKSSPSSSSSSSTDTLSNPNTSYSSSSNAVSWISSSSPKGTKRIPYAIYTAHSYTINKLKVSLTQLVDTATVEKQNQLKAQMAAMQYAPPHYAQRGPPHYSHPYPPRPPHVQRPYMPSPHFPMRPNVYPQRKQYPQQK